MNWVIAFTTPLFLAKSSSGPYFLWGGATAFAVGEFVEVFMAAFTNGIVIFMCFMYETKGRSLESIDDAFEVSPLQEMMNKVSHRRRHVNDGTVGREEDVERARVTQNGVEK